MDKNHHLGLGDIRLTIGQQEEIEQQIKELKELLKIAQCPNNCDDGSIAHGSNETGWEQEQCQFCDERNQALKK